MCHSFYVNQDLFLAIVYSSFFINYILSLHWLLPLYCLLYLGQKSDINFRSLFFLGLTFEKSSPIHCLCLFTINLFNKWLDAWHCFCPYIRSSSEDYQWSTCWLPIPIHIPVLSVNPWPPSATCSSKLSPLKTCFLLTCTLLSISRPTPPLYSIFIYFTGSEDL